MENHPVNIRVSTEDKKEDMPQPLSNNVYENFLITTNKDYRREIQTLQEKLQATERERDEFEEDNGKIETSQRYMRGILKNYYEIDQQNKKISDTANGLVNSSHRTSFLVKVMAVIVSISSLVVLSQDNWLYTAPPIILFLFSLSALYDNLILRESHVLDKMLKDTAKEINDIKKTNELLPDLFDNL